MEHDASTAISSVTVLYIYLSNPFISMIHTLSILDPFNIRPLARVAYYNPTTRQLISTDTFRLHITHIDLWASPIYFDKTGNETTTVRSYKNKRDGSARKKTPYFIDSLCPVFPDIEPFMDRTNYETSEVQFHIHKIKELIKHPLIANHNTILHNDGSITIALKDWLTERHENIFTAIPNLPRIGINLQYLFEGIQYLNPLDTVIEWKNPLAPIHFSDSKHHALIMPLKI